MTDGPFKTIPASSVKQRRGADWGDITVGADVRAEGALVARARRERLSQRERLLPSVYSHRALYAMILPGFVFLILIRVVPAAGCVMAWQDYSIFKGIWGSRWVGWQNFRTLFGYHDFVRIFRNTFLMGLYRIVFAFPVPILLALLVNEVQCLAFKRCVQTVLYLPYFLSWVVVSQLVINMLDPASGLVNILLRQVFNINPIFFMGKESYFQPIVLLSYIWKHSGYQSIIYLAALTAIDPQLYEAATMDGASRWRQTWVIAVPLLMPTIVVVFLLSIGQFLEIGFDQVWTLINPLVWSTGDIFDTFEYRVGLREGRYSLTTAIGMFKAVIGLTLILGGNAASRRLTGKGFF